MPNSFVPNLCRYGVRPIAEPRDGFGEGQRGALGIGEVGRIMPSRNCKDALVSFARFFEHAPAHVNADATAIDLARAQVDQPQYWRRHTALFRSCVESEQGLHR